MPRVNGVFSLLSGSKGTPDTTIQSAPYNSQLDDFAQDLNLARPVTAGGTGATTASGARSNLGLVPGTDVQAFDDGLKSIAGLTTLADQMLYTTGSDVYATTALTPYGRSILALADVAALKTSLSLGALASKGSINDADWSGADLSIANGGTGASTAAAARDNLGLGNVTNTSDANKPVSNAQQNALDQKLNKAGGILTGDVPFGPGTGGKYSILQANGDVALNRGDGTGYITYATGNAYFGWDGGRYAFGPAGGVAVYGYLQVDGPGLSSKLGPSGDLDFSGFMLNEFGPYLSTRLRGYVSAQQSWTLGGSLVVAHGLGRIPNQVWLILVCKSAVSGYSVGDRIIVAASAARDENYYNEGYSAQVDATNVRISFASNFIGIVQKGGGAAGGAYPSGFDLIVVARL